MLVLRRQVFKSGLPERLCSRVTGASLFGSLIPANSKTAWRSRQFPAIAPGIAASAGWIRRFRVLDLVRGWIASVLSLLRSWIVFGFCPTACAVGCVLSPLRGLGLSLCFSAWRFALRLVARLGFLAGAVAASRAGAPALRGSIGGPNSGYSIRYCGRSRDFAHHQLLADPVMDVVQAGVFCVPRGDPHCCPLTFMWMHLRTLGWG